MVPVPDLIENRWELAALVVFLSAGAVSLAGYMGLEGVAGFLSIVGFVILLPLVVLFGDHVIETEESDAEDPLQNLRDRYARGELSHEEFERRVDRLVETEDVERAAADALDDHSREERTRELE